MKAVAALLAAWTAGIFWEAVSKPVWLNVAVSFTMGVAIFLFGQWLTRSIRRDRP